MRQQLAGNDPSWTSTLKRSLWLECELAPAGFTTRWSPVTYYRIQDCKQTATNCCKTARVERETEGRVERTCTVVAIDTPEERLNFEKSCGAGYQFKVLFKLRVQRRLKRDNCWAQKRSRRGSAPGRLNRPFRWVFLKRSLRRALAPWYQLEVLLCVQQKLKLRDNC